MKNIFQITLFLFILLVFKSYGQDENKEVNKVEAKLSGFIKNDVFYDTRQYEYIVEGLFNAYPKNKLLDSNGKDLNQNDEITMVNMSSRLKLNVTGLKIANANLKGYIEVDFTGSSDFTGLRLRQAYTQADWKKFSILLGRTWHPLFVTQAYPTVNSFNTGAPFGVFIRNPMATFTYKPWVWFNIHFSAISQSTSADFGPNDGDSKFFKADYLRHSVLPNLNLRTDFITKNSFFGFAVDYKELRPRLFTRSLTDITKTYSTDQRVKSFIFMSFYKYSSDKLDIRLRAMYQQNGTEHFMFGGYAVSNIDSVTGAEEYTPINYANAWINVLYGKKFKIGFFAGFSKNLGAGKNIVNLADYKYLTSRFPANNDYKIAAYYSRGVDEKGGFDIAYAYRICPMFVYTVDKFSIGMDFEYTAAAYGKFDVNNKGKVSDTYEVFNFRTLLTLMYNF